MHPQTGSTLSLLCSKSNQNTTRGITQVKTLKRTYQMSGVSHCISGMTVTLDGLQKRGNLTTLSGCWMHNEGRLTFFSFPLWRDHDEKTSRIS